MLVLLQVPVTTVIAFPLTLTVLLPCEAPKVVPVMTKPICTGPEVNERLVMPGVTVKGFPLLATQLRVTTTFPVVALLGTLTPMLLLVQIDDVAVTPLKVTLPGVVPKFDPVIVTEAPTAPEDCDRLVIVGAPTTVKVCPLLATPATVTTTFPVVAPGGTVAPMLEEPQLVVVAAFPLNVTEPLDPKFEPPIVTHAPMAPETGVRLDIVGAVAKACAVQSKITKIPAIAGFLDM
jgi:hypothetical protein